MVILMIIHLFLKKVFILIVICKTVSAQPVIRSPVEKLQCRSQTNRAAAVFLAKMIKMAA